MRTRRGPIPTRLRGAALVTDMPNNTRLAVFAQSAPSGHFGPASPKTTASVALYRTISTQPIASMGENPPFRSYSENKIQRRSTRSQARQPETTPAAPHNHTSATSGHAAQTSPAGHAPTIQAETTRPHAQPSEGTTPPENTRPHPARHTRPASLRRGRPPRRDPRRSSFLLIMTHVASRGAPPS